MHLPISFRLQLLCDEFIEHKVSNEYFIFHFTKLLFEKQDSKTDLIRIAQTMRSMTPVSGDG